jgi:effector-binding domain-containing protein
MFEVATRHEDSQRYESLSKQVASDEIDRFVREAIRELRERHAEAGRPFSIYTGCDKDDEQFVEVCLPTEVGSKTLPGGAIAFTTVRGEQCEYPEILSAYDAVFGYASSLGLPVAGPPREIYLTDFETADSLEMQIAVPLAEARS